jgi:hypothetical protein
MNGDPHRCRTRPQDAQPRRQRSGRRHPRRDGHRRAHGAVQVRAGGWHAARRRKHSATHLPRVQPHAGHHHRVAAGSLRARSICAGVMADRTSPIAYGYDAQLPVYFNQDPVITWAAAGALRRRWQWAGAAAEHAEHHAHGQTCGALHLVVAADSTGAPTRPIRPGAGRVARPRCAGGRGQEARRPASAASWAGRPRVIMQFPANASDMLLSGTLAGGEALAEPRAARRRARSARGTW